MPRSDAREQAHRQPGRLSGTEVRRRIRMGEPWRPLVPPCDELAADADTVARTGEA